MERGGYRTVKLGNASEDFDAGRVLDFVELFAFVKATQAGEWGRLAKLHGGEDRARRRFAGRLAKEIGGRAKAMVVTSSRKLAVRMTRALRKYVDEHGYGSLGILVAFSGMVEDEGTPYSEPQMSDFPR